MSKSFTIISILVALLAAGVLVAGCSSSDSSSSSQNPSATAAVTTSASSSAALYSAGDIVKNPKSSSTSGLLIIGYDAASDKYERAYVYPNSDGTWGYRMDSKTEKIDRSTIDKVYTQKVTNKAVSAVPVKTPTPAVTPTIAYTTATTTAASVTATTTTASGLSPKVTSIEPDKGTTGATVSITDLVGINFQSGATVTLVKSGNTNISATNVNVKSANLITCTFVIPSNTTTGYWNIVLTNPDGQYHQFQNGFNVVQSTSTTTSTTTTTTTTTSTGSATISSVSPPTAVTGGADTYIVLYITGTNLGSASNIKLTSSSGTTISGSSYYASSSTNAQASFNIPANSNGAWTVSIVDSSGSVLSSLSNGLTIS